VQVCPDEALLEINNVGRVALAAIRDILGAVSAVPAHALEPTLRHHGDSRAVAAQERHIADKLSAVAAARNREFARLLAQSQIPEAAVDKICAALNDEPVPSADPLVMLLLDTAGEVGLMRLYRSTHSDQDE
jgi:hypothetical protein